MAAARRKMAKAEGVSIQDEDGIEQAWLHRRGIAFPAVEHFLVAAPRDRLDKDGPGFEAAWQAAASAAATGRENQGGMRMGADSGFEPSVPRLSVVLVCYGCKACNGEADRAAGGRF